MAERRFWWEHVYETWHLRTNVAMPEALSGSITLRSGWYHGQVWSKASDYREIPVGDYSSLEAAKRRVEESVRYRLQQIKESRSRGHPRTKGLDAEAARRSRDAKRQGRDKYGRFA
jgi:hypothetical protein